MRYKPLNKNELLCNHLQVVVLMGGLGTRLKDQTMECPKPLLPIHGKPFFEYELELMLLSGFRKFVFLVGYRAEMIEQYFGNGSRYGDDISITYSYDGEELLGTGGAIIKALPNLEEDFLLVYADSFMDVDYFEIVYRYYLGKADGMKALMTVMENRNKFDSSNVIYNNGRIQVYDKKHFFPEMSFIDYGIEVFAREVFEEMPKNRVIDLADIQQKLVREGKCVACEETHRFYEIGTPESLDVFKNYSIRRFQTSHSACFIDRDGVINRIVFNEDTEQLDSPLSIEEFCFLPEAVEGLKKISDMGMDIFIVSNQPVAAKGKTVLAMLYDINTYMIKRLQEKGIKVEGISICPHHPTGSRKTRESFLIQECDCRKPHSGMIVNIMKKNRIDMKKSYMIGDSYTDMIAGQKAGLKTAFVGNYKCDICGRLNYVKPDIIGKNLLIIANQIENEIMES